MTQPSSALQTTSTCQQEFLEIKKCRILENQSAQINKTLFEVQLILEATQPI
jgi:hypothetical protein